MRILKIFDGDYPWDVRVEKITDSLLAAGHEVRLVCRNRRGDSRFERLPGGLEIRRLPGLAGSLSFPFFLNPIWVAVALREILSFRPDRILVRDLPLAPLAICLGWFARVPVVADLAEPYPASLRSLWSFQSMSLTDHLVRNPVFADWVERAVVRHAAGIVVVCPEAGERLERQGLAQHGWTEVGNTPRLDRFQPSGAPTQPEFYGLEGRCVMFFSGLLAGDRGVDLALEALGLLEVRTPGRFALVVVGEGPVRAALQAQAAAIGIGDQVRFTGFVEHTRLPDLIACASIGLLPFRACEHIHCTLANKLFEYMAVGLPVVVSDAPPMKRVINETHAGVSFRSDDALDLARTIEALAADDPARKQMSLAGRRAVAERYHWEVDARRLLEALDAAG